MTVQLIHQHIYQKPNPYFIKQFPQIIVELLYDVFLILILLFQTVKLVLNNRLQSIHIIEVDIIVHIF